jgi:quercetin dioxygenase-like cupin family protein
MEISILEKGKDLVRGSFEYLINSPVVKNLKIATALLPDWKIFEKLRDQGLFYRRFDFNGNPCCFIYKGDEFDVSQRPSNSKGSQAIYLARKDNGNESYLLQLLPPYAVTSRHYHKITTENFHNLEGSCNIVIDGTNNQLNRGTMQVLPRQVHQVKTVESESLNLIEMLGNPRGLSMDDHFYI